MKSYDRAKLRTNFHTKCKSVLTKDTHRCPRQTEIVRSIRNRKPISAPKRNPIFTPNANRFRAKWKPISTPNATQLPQQTEIVRSGRYGNPRSHRTMADSHTEMQIIAHTTRKVCDPKNVFREFVRREFPRTLQITGFAKSESP